MGWVRCTETRQQSFGSNGSESQHPRCVRGRIGARVRYASGRSLSALRSRQNDRASHRHLSYPRAPFCSVCGLFCCYLFPSHRSSCRMPIKDLLVLAFVFQEQPPRHAGGFQSSLPSSLCAARALCAGVCGAGAVPTGFMPNCAVQEHASLSRRQLPRQLMWSSSWRLPR